MRIRAWATLLVVAVIVALSVLVLFSRRAPGVTMSDHLAFTSELGDTSLDVVDEVPLDDEFGNPPQDETPVVDPDHPILTQREAWGWYFYEVANSVYSSVVISGYLPVLVTDFAKYAAYDSSDVCQVNVLGVSVRPAAYTTATTSLSVLIEAALFILTGAVADFGALRKKMMIGTSYFGALLTIAIFFVSTSHLFWLAGLFMVLSNVFFGYSIVFYNAYLAPLVRSHPDYVKAPKEERHATFDEIGNQMSTKGFMSGYAAGTIMLIVSIPLIFFLPSSTRPYYDCAPGRDPILVEDVGDRTFAYRVAILISGLWWMVFTVFPHLWVNTRPGPPLPAVWGTLKEIKQLKHTFLFLTCYFLLSDGYSTVSSVGVLFATQELQADGIVLGIMLVEVPLFAFIGNWVWLKVKDKWNFTSKFMVGVTGFCMLLLPIYTLLGFIPFLPFGLKNIWELYVFAAFYGFNIGAIQSFARTVYMALTPPGHESEFFGFYELTDKGTAWIGPAVVAILTQVTGSLRAANFWLLISFLAPLILLKFVDVDKGIADAKAFREREDQLMLAGSHFVHRNIQSSDFTGDELAILSEE